jgi:hypothetical protein
MYGPVRPEHEPDVPVPLTQLAGRGEERRPAGDRSVPADDYRTGVEFTGDTGRAFRAATIVLLSNGFQIVEEDGSTVVYQGPGMISSRQNPLVGASRIEIARQGDRLVLAAELGGIRTMRRFLFALPVGLAALFLVVFGLTLPVPFAQAALFSIAPLLPWIVLSPLLANWIERRTCRALDTLLAQVASLGGAP